MTPPDVPGRADKGLGPVAAGLVLDVDDESILAEKDAIGGNGGPEMVSGTLLRVDQDVCKVLGCSIIRTKVRNVKNP